MFNAITKSAVTEAMKNPRQVDQELVEAYLARRALDYLVGFNLSPVLWRKLPGAKSAGRVQSVCLRLIVEREMEIEAFRAQEYWTVKALLTTPRGQDYEARLTVLGGKKLDKFDIPNATAAELAVQAITSPRSDGQIGRGETRQPQPLGPVHDLDPAAGSQPQVRHRRAADDAARRNGSMRPGTSPICGPTASTWRPRR